MEKLSKNYINRDFEVSSLDSVEPSPGGKKKPSWHNLRYIFIGIGFGILLVKGEVVSWFRIQEMFRFQSFHMYGVIGSAILVGVISVLLIKKFNLRSLNGERIELPKKKFNKGQVYGGLLFGLGWAITGACPGPLFAQIGTGATVVIITLLSAVAGTWVYGLISPKLPH
ncbi:MAG TPA: DUF6691 family protein [Chitinophagaceae bacterium]|nr:DUF6691 family protein [Chitinophagaceae bacterium]